MATFRLRGVTVRHLTGSRAAALHALDLTIGAGEQVALIGPSGAGKTTLLATLASAHQPSEGTLEILGQEPWHLPHAARHRLRARL
ncbi:MAG: ATP-binding cassette domain-containing protein, partial [Oxalobacteraceae bacterium]